MIFLGIIGFLYVYMTNNSYQGNIINIDKQQIKQINISVSNQYYHDLNIIEDNMEKTQQACVNGTIVTVKSKKSGRNISCVIKNDNNILTNVDLKNALIIDSTGYGWLILHKNDEVKIYYEKDKGVKDEKIIGSTVFIKKAAN